MNINISISNIGWPNGLDAFIYGKLKQLGYNGIEIAPTRLFGKYPYDNLAEAKAWSTVLFEKYNLKISSMQSIWYGCTEKIWGSDEEREQLTIYTKKAIDFAKVIDCRNIVFGCPQNRSIPPDGNLEAALSFFKELGDYAYDKGTCIGIEANPPIYDTNFINTTSEAIELIWRIDSKGFKLNLDIGTMICNDEGVNVVAGHEGIINHVHLSEPFLKPIKRRRIHEDIIDMLRDSDYGGYISVEMERTDDTNKLIDSILYLKELVWC